MNYLWKLGRLGGVDVYLHWPFLIVPAWVALTSLAAGAALASAVSATFLVLAVFGCVLLLIGLFVFVAARSEAHAVTPQPSAPSQAAMPAATPSFILLPAHARADEVVGVLSSPQYYFPVAQGGEVVGVLSKAMLLRALANARGDRLIAELMTETVPELPSVACAVVEVESRNQ